MNDSFEFFIILNFCDVPITTIILSKFYVSDFNACDYVKLIVMIVYVVGNCNDIKGFKKK